MIESAAMVGDLVAAHPDAAARTCMAPSPGSADHGVFLSGLHFMSMNVYPMVDVAGGHAADYAADPAHEKHIQAVGLAKLSKNFGIVEQRLASDGPFLMGATASALALYLFMLTLWDKPSERAVHDAFPQIAQVATAVRARSALQATLTHHGALGIGADHDVSPLTPRASRWHVAPRASAHYCTGPDHGHRQTRQPLGRCPCGNTRSAGPVDLSFELARG